MTGEELVDAFATTTGQIVTDSLPLLWLVIGTVFALLALGLIIRVFKYGLKQAFKS